MPIQTARAQHLSYSSFQSHLQHSLLYSMSSWLTRGRGERRRREGGREKKKEKGEWEGRDKKEVLKLQRHLHWTHLSYKILNWEGVTKSSNIGFVLVLNQKNIYIYIFCVFHFLCHCSWQKLIRLTSPNLQRIKVKNLVTAQGKYNVQSRYSLVHTNHSVTVYRALGRINILLKMDKWDQWTTLSC